MIPRILRLSLLCVSCTALAVELSLLPAAAMYDNADVSCLATACLHTPPGKRYQRLDGLELAPEVPPVVEMALKQGELNDFETAWPVQPMRIARSIVYSLQTGKRIGNTSGLEQQLAKNLFVGSERTLWRKYREAVYAVKLYRTYSKAELMRVYVSLAQTGPDVYGFHEAAEVYFGKSADRLTLPEAMLIMQMLPAPQKRAHKYRQHLCSGLFWWMHGALVEQGYGELPAYEAVIELDDELTNKQKGNV